MLSVVARKSRRDERGVERILEITYVKLGAAYYGMCIARPSDTNI